MPDAIDYNISAFDANQIIGATQLSHEYRVQILMQYGQTLGVDALANLFSQFMGLANSVVENAQEWLSIHLISNNISPDQVDKLNHSTIFGALNGCLIAEDIDQDKLCHGCAFRIGSCANQSPATTCDADWALKDEQTFYCHEVMDENDNPVRKCRGYTQAKKKLAA